MNQAYREHRMKRLLISTTFLTLTAYTAATGTLLPCCGRERKLSYRYQLQQGQEA